MRWGDVHPFLGAVVLLEVQYWKDGGEFERIMRSVMMMDRNRALTAAKVELSPERAGIAYRVDCRLYVRIYVM